MHDAGAGSYSALSFLPQRALTWRLSVPQQQPTTLTDGTTICFDDRTLTHLQIVIVQKFIKGESFLMSRKDDVSVGDGRSSIWLSLTIPVYFTFDGGRVPTINRDWLLALVKSAESSSGPIVTLEDGELAKATRPQQAGYPASCGAALRRCDGLFAPSPNGTL